MKSNFLFPNRYKVIGWLLFIPSLLVGLFLVISGSEPVIFDWSWPSVFIDDFFGDKKWFGFVENNMLNEIVALVTIISGLLVAFSKEKQEDEFISQIRTESLVWSVYVNYIILLFAILFIFDLSFLWVMIANMFTILIFFIVRFNWRIARLQRSLRYAE